jgi:glycosyltransferase involved in cell wall biosynthesis
MPNDAPILLDVTRLIWRRWKGRHPTGIDRVCLAYLDHYRGCAQAVVQHDRFRRILGRKASAELFDLLGAPSRHFRRSLVFGLLRHLGYFDRDGANRLYLNIGHTGLDKPGFRRWTTEIHVRPIYFVHDLSPITHPQYCRAGEGDKHRERMRAVLATGAGVIGNSQVTLDELARFARQESFPNPPSVVGWLGVDPLATTQPAPNSAATFVTIGTIEARKNHRMLLDLWSRLVVRLGERAPKLLIIGQRGWEAQSVFNTLDRSRTLRGRVVELNRCSDEQLAQHLAEARALLFPSFVEGYGLPLAEALAAGVPAIASDLPVFREIGGAIPEYLDPCDIDSWETAIVDYARPQSARREAQLRRMKGFRAPTWAQHFKRVDAWLANLG